MTQDASIIHYFWQAGLVVKLVMLMLLSASVMSWTFIFQRRQLFKKISLTVRSFEEAFWSGIDISKLYQRVSSRQGDKLGLEPIFLAGYNEFLKWREVPHASPEIKMANVQRAMRIAQAREVESLEKNVSFLATVGSTSPYVGLFGTVWGIMTAFQALGNVEQASISMVAPGISEALIATAIGLFAAIPAVIAYNRYSNEIMRIENHYEAFAEEFSNVISQELAQPSKTLG